MRFPSVAASEKQEIVQHVSLCFRDDAITE